MLIALGDTGGVSNPQADSVKLSPSDVLTVLALYVLVHCSVYLWYQTRRQQGGVGQKSVPSPGSSAGANIPGRRRVGSGIHRSEHRKRVLVRVAIAFVALTLAGTVIATIGDPGSSP